MVPYTIQCTTCRRQLTVRSLAAVGKILPCPKCGSMVLVEPPPSPPRRSGASTPTTSEPQSPRAALEDDDLDAILAAADPQQADTVTDPQAAELPVAAASALVGTSPESQPRPLDRDWMSAETRQMRRWLLIGAAGSAMVLLVIISAGFWLSRQPVARVAEPPASQATIPPAPPQLSSKNPLAEPPVEPPAATTETRREPSSETTASDDTPAPDAVPAEPSKTPPDDGKNADSAAAQAAGIPATPPASRPGAPRPLTIDEALRDFANLMSDHPEPEDAARTASPFDLIPAPGRTFDLGAALPKPVPRTVNVEAQLAVKVKQAEFPQVPLAGFLQVISDFTMIPITLDIEGLMRLGLTPQTPVQVALSDAAMGQILDDALGRLGLEYQIDSTAGGHIVVRPQGTERYEDREYDVFDLVGENPAEAQALAAALVSLVLPATWQPNGGEGTLRWEDGKVHVHQTSAGHYEANLWLERLRLARGGRPQGNVPDFAMRPPPRLSSALANLGQSVTANFPVPTPLGQILAHLSEASGVSLVVDWRILAAAGCTPESLARLEANEVPLSEALQMLLGPMDLSFRVLDANTLQVTTRSVAFGVWDVEFFPVRDQYEEGEGRRLTEGLRAILGDAAGGQAATGVMRIDATSKTMVVAAPQFQIAAIARLLESLRAPVAPVAPVAPDDADGEPVPP